MNPTPQDYLRQQAIRLREQGKRFVEIATYLGVHRNTVSDWWRQYQETLEIDSALWTRCAVQDLD